MSNLFYIKFQGHALRACLFHDNSLAILARNALSALDLKEEQYERIIGSKMWITKQEFLRLLMYSVLCNTKSEFGNMTVGNIKEILNEAEEELLSLRFSHETT